MCQNCDFQKLMQGLYENFLNLRFRDNNFELVQRTNEWFMFTDNLSTISRHNQDFSMLKYQVYLPTLFHVYSSSVSLAQNQKFKYPSEQYEVESLFSSYIAYKVNYKVLIF